MNNKNCDQCGKSPITHGWKAFNFCSLPCAVNFRERIEKGDAE